MIYRPLVQVLARGAFLGLLAGAIDVGSVVAQPRNAATTPLSQSTLYNYDTGDLLRAARNAQSAGHCDDFRAIMDELRRRSYVTVHQNPEISLTELILFQQPRDEEFSTRRYDPTRALGPVRADEFGKLEDEGCPRRSTSGVVVSANAGGGTVDIPPTSFLGVRPQARSTTGLASSAPIRRPA